jgi:hypothetical protein
MDDSTPNSPDWEARSAARWQELRDMFDGTTARVVSLFSYYSELNNRTLLSNRPDVLRRLDAAESRLSVIEKHLNIPPLA